MLEHRRIGSPVPDFLLPGLDPDVDPSADRDHSALKRRMRRSSFSPGTTARTTIDTSTGAGIGYARLFDDVFFGPLDKAIAYYGECLHDSTAMSMRYMRMQCHWRLSRFPALQRRPPDLRDRMRRPCRAVPPHGLRARPWHRRSRSRRWPRFRSLTHFVQVGRAPLRSRWLLVGQQDRIPHGSARCSRAHVRAGAARIHRASSRA